MERLTSVFGLASILLFCFLISRKRSAISYRIVFWGLSLQVVILVLVLGIPALNFSGPLEFLFEFFNRAFNRLIQFSSEGAGFVFGPLSDSKSSFGFIFAFMVLPTIIFFSTLVAVLYHLGILQKVVWGFAVIIKKLMPVSGPETLSTTANIFLGQTEAPLLIKPYLSKMTQSELFCVMVGGMANVAGSVMAAFVAMLQSRDPHIAGHLLTVSVMSAPSTLLVSKMILPETEPKKLSHELRMDTGFKDANVLEAATRGAQEGLYLALNVGAMLIAFIALVATLNFILGAAGHGLGFDCSLEGLFRYAMMPFAFLMGVPFSDLPTVSQLLGEKIVLNEFVAYTHLSQIGAGLSDRGFLIASYALCGFANFSSIGIQVGGIGVMAPDRRADLAKLGLWALLAGNLATFVSACFVGIFL